MQAFILFTWDIRNGKYESHDSNLCSYQGRIQDFF